VFKNFDFNVEIWLSWNYNTKAMDLVDLVLAILFLANKLSYNFWLDFEICQYFQTSETNQH